MYCPAIKVIIGRCERGEIGRGEGIFSKRDLLCFSAGVRAHKMSGIRTVMMEAGAEPPQN